MSNNSELTQQNSKEIKTLERLLSFPYVPSQSVPAAGKPDVKTTAVTQGSIKKRSDLDQLERILSLGA